MWALLPVALAAIISRFALAGQRGAQTSSPFRQFSTHLTMVMDVGIVLCRMYEKMY